MGFDTVAGQAWVACEIADFQQRTRSEIILLVFFRNIFLIIL
jgi:hypothetical protein